MVFDDNDSGPALGFQSWGCRRQEENGCLCVLLGIGSVPLCHLVVVSKCYDLFLPYGTSRGARGGGDGRWRGAHGEGVATGRCADFNALYICVHVVVKI